MFGFKRKNERIKKLKSEIETEAFRLSSLLSDVALNNDRHNYEKYKAEYKQGKCGVDTFSVYQGHYISSLEGVEEVARDILSLIEKLEKL